MEPSTITASIDETIRFKKADLEALKDSQDGYLHSRKFFASPLSDVSYYILIYPNGNRDDCRGKVSMFLHFKNGTAINVDADIMFVIESANFQSVSMSDNGRGVWLGQTSKFYDSNFFKYDNLILKVKGTFKITLPSAIKYPFSAQWKIKDSDLQALKSTNNGCLRSKRFSIFSDSEIKYHISIYPNGNTDEHRGNSYIFLFLGIGAESKINAVFCFSIDSADYSHNLLHVYDKTNKGWGSAICSTEDLFNPDKRFFVDGEMTLTANGTLMIEKQLQQTVLASEKGFASKAYQRRRGKNFSIAVGEKVIKVHKKVLLEASPVFAAMFDSGMNEVEEKKMSITDFDYDVVNAAIKLLYSDSVPPKFSYEQMLSLLQFSDKYDIALIKDLVQDYFITNLSTTNVCSLLNFTANTVSATKLLVKCKEYIAKCSKESKTIPDLDILDKDLLLGIFKGTFYQTLETDIG